MECNKIDGLRLYLNEMKIKKNEKWKEWKCFHFIYLNEKKSERNENIRDKNVVY